MREKEEGKGRGREIGVSVRERKEEAKVRGSPCCRYLCMYLSFDGKVPKCIRTIPGIQLLL